MTDTPEQMTWTTSRHCGSDGCVEVAEASDDVHIRQSENPNGRLTFTRAAWRDFLAAVRAGEFDAS
jgi:Domain of unknown function (DUF397)